WCVRPGRWLTCWRWSATPAPRSRPTWQPSAAWSPTTWSTAARPAGWPGSAAASWAWPSRSACPWSCRTRGASAGDRRCWRAAPGAARGRGRRGGGGGRAPAAPPRGALGRPARGRPRLAVYQLGELDELPALVAAVPAHTSGGGRAQARLQRHSDDAAYHHAR